MNHSTNKSTYPLKLPVSIKRAAQRLAKEDGVSLNQWIAVAVAQKVGAAETAANTAIPAANRVRIIGASARISCLFFIQMQIY